MIAQAAADPTLWDRITDVAGYLSPLAFFLLGVAGTNWNNSRLESSRRAQAKEDRNSVYQREQLLECQRLATEIWVTITRYRTPLSNRPNIKVLNWNWVGHNPEVEKLANYLSTAATTLLDDEAVRLATVFAIYATSVGSENDQRNKSHEQLIFDASTRITLIYNDLKARVGELLKTTYV